MSVREPALAGRAPLQRAALIGLVTAVVVAAALVWAVLNAPVALRDQVAFGGGGAAVLCCVAAVIAAYCAVATRGVRDSLSVAGADAGRLERELAQLLEETLPALIQRIPAGAPIDGMLADLPRPDSGALRQLLDTVARELTSGQRRAVAAMAAYAAVEQDATRLTEADLPDVVRQLREGEPVDLVLAAARKPAGDALPRLLDGAAREIAAAERRGAAALGACASAAARVQAQTTRMLADLRQLQDAYSDAAIFADLMELDHAVSQLGRLADGIALLAGGRSGRRWTKPIVMESILRGAMGRIDGYRRVRLNSTSTAAVAGYAAEGVMHALAELMDNAAAFSAHGSAVHVYVEEEDAGVVITIEDSGLGMRKRERERAERLVSESLDLSRLPGTRLGLAVVGRLARRYGLTVSFRPSSRGGIGVVLMVPHRLITHPAQAAAPALGPSLAEPRVPATVAAARTEAVVAATQHGLPRRPRGVTLAAAAARARAEADELPARDPAETTSRFAAFRQAGRGSEAGSWPAHASEEGDR